MAIDPMLYEKLSRRKGDPRDRMGEVLLDDLKERQARKRAKESPLSERQITSYFKAKAAASAILGVFLIVMLLLVRGCH
ncbi:MAG: hypothetical protein WC718_11030 [Phycisphaerales bacterium]